MEAFMAFVNTIFEVLKGDAFKMAVTEADRLLSAISISNVAAIIQKVIEAFGK